MSQYESRQPLRPSAYPYTSQPKSPYYGDHAATGSSLSPFRNTGGYLAQGAGAGGTSLYPTDKLYQATDNINPWNASKHISAPGYGDLTNKQFTATVDSRLDGPSKPLAFLSPRESDTYNNFFFKNQIGGGGGASPGLPYSSQHYRQSKSQIGTRNTLLPSDIGTFNTFDKQNSYYLSKEPTSAAAYPTSNDINLLDQRLNRFQTPFEAHRATSQTKFTVGNSNFRKSLGAFGSGLKMGSGLKDSGYLLNSEKKNVFDRLPDNHPKKTLYTQVKPSPDRHKAKKMNKDLLDLTDLEADRPFLTSNLSLKQSCQEQFEANQRIIERAQKLIQNNQDQLKLNSESETEKRVTFRNDSKGPRNNIITPKSANLQQNKSQDRYQTSELQFDQELMDGEKSNWTPYPQANNESIQYLSEKPQNVIVYKSDIEVPKKEKKMANFRGGDGSYNQRHEKYMNTLQEIEHRLQGMQPIHRERSKSKGGRSKSRDKTAKYATKKSPRFNDGNQGPGQKAATFGFEQDDMQPAFKKTSSSESIGQEKGKFPDQKIQIVDEEVCIINKQKRPTATKSKRAGSNKMKKRKQSPARMIGFKEESPDEDINGIEILVQGDTLKVNQNISDTPIKKKSSQARNGNGPQPTFEQEPEQSQPQKRQTSKNKKVIMQKYQQIQKIQNQGRHSKNGSYDDSVLLKSPNYDQNQQSQTAPENKYQTIQNQTDSDPSDPTQATRVTFAEPTPKQMDDISVSKYSREPSVDGTSSRPKKRKIVNSKVLDSTGFSVNPNRVSKDDIKGKKIKKLRTVILGCENVGKTCLFLRYMYFDKSKKIQVQQTPCKDGHIFTKRIIGKQFVHEYEIWDFLGQSELSNRKVGNEDYDVFQQNIEYISWADSILLVFDVNNLETFKYCQRIGEKLKMSKKVLYVANKCDITDPENSDLLSDVRLSDRHQLVRVSARNTFGLKKLFSEIDNEYADDFIKTKKLDVQVTPKANESKMILMRSDKQETISLQLAYLAFRVDIRFKEDIDNKCFHVRSSKEEKKIDDLNSSQVKEILGKIDQMRDNINRYMSMAQDEQLTSTVEFENASKKLMELASVEQAIQKKVKSKGCQKYFLWSVVLAVTALTIWSFLNYISVGQSSPIIAKSPEDMVEQRITKAETEIYNYHKSQLQEAQEKISGYGAVLESYKKTANQNLYNLELYSKKDAPVTKLKQQVFVVEKMVQNRLNLIESGFYNPDQILTDISELKTLEEQLKSYGIEKGLIDSNQLTKTKFVYKTQIGHLKVQGSMLQQASSTMYSAYKQYLNFYKKKNDPDADKFIREQQNIFNDEIHEIIRNIKQDIKSSSNLVREVQEFNKPLASALKLVEDQIDVIKRDGSTSKFNKMERCQRACLSFQTEKCPKPEEMKDSDVSYPSITLASSEGRSMMISQANQLVSIDNISTLDLLNKLRTDSDQLMKKSSDSINAAQRIDISNANVIAPSKQAVELFSSYTNQACDAAMGTKTPQDNAQKKLEAEQSAAKSFALMIFGGCASVLILLIALMTCNRKKASFFNEWETGADDLNISISTDDSSSKSTTDKNA